MGRRTGSPNRGYFHRSGRGWYTTVEGRMVPLRDDEDNHLRDKNTPQAKLKAAHRKIIAQPVGVVNSGGEKGENGPKESADESTTVDVICKAYLAKAKMDGAKKTHDDRAATLWDFCTGFSPSIMKLPESERAAEMTPANRIHKGYGQIPVSRLLPLDVDQWLAAHPDWKGGKRTRIQAVKRSLNYGVECGLIPKSQGSPLRGYRVPRAIPRVTYLTPEQEKAMYLATNAEFAKALKVCIRTGARPGAEFGKLTAKHVRDNGDRMEWFFPAKQNKTGKQTRKPRVIRITDSEIIRIVRQQVVKFPTSAIFRNTKGTPWLRKNLELSFRKAKLRLRAKGIELDEDAVMYSTRHTYAKRILQGYWSGRQTNIETLARLMGNAPQVCREHYLQWSDSYEEPLWESA
jgi:integrase